MVTQQQRNTDTLAVKNEDRVAQLMKNGVDRAQAGRGNGQTYTIISMLFDNENLKHALCARLLCFAWDVLG